VRALGSREGDKAAGAGLTLWVGRLRSGRWGCPVGWGFCGLGRDVRVG
jgi:hypothetical protein